MKSIKKKKKSIKIGKSLFIILIIFSFLGMFFFSVLFEEAVHVVQGGGAKSVCIDYNLELNDNVEQGALYAHTSFDLSKWEGVEEFYSWRAYSEKVAYVLKTGLIILLSLGVGFLFAKSVF